MKKKLDLFQICIEDLYPIKYNLITLPKLIATKTTKNIISPTTVALKKTHPYLFENSLILSTFWVKGFGYIPQKATEFEITFKDGSIKRIIVVNGSEAYRDLVRY